MCRGAKRSRLMTQPSADLEWLREQPLVEALWWFIENHGGYSTSVEQGMFFMLRERYRLEHQTQ